MKETKRQRWATFSDGLEAFVGSVQKEEGIDTWSHALVHIVTQVRKFHSSAVRRFLLDQAKLHGTNGIMDTALDIVRDAMKEEQHNG